MRCNEVAFGKYPFSEGGNYELFIKEERK